MQPRLSFIIPFMDEEDTLRELADRIDTAARACLAPGETYELVFIDDGSRDKSVNVVEQLVAERPELRLLELQGNFGKSAALAAGFSEARGQVVFTLDADLQDDPHEIPHFLAQIRGGLDVVSGWKKIRHDPWHKVFPSRVFNKFLSVLTGVHLHDHNCGMKAYRAEIFREVHLYGEMHRFVPVLAFARGFKVGEQVIHHRARKFGRSKYGVTRIVKGFLDLLTVYFLTGFEQRPQHMLGTLGILAFFVGFCGLLYLAIYWLVDKLVPDWQLEDLHNRPAVIYSMGALLLGAQLMSMGFLAELFTAYYGRSSRPYSIKSRVNLPAPGKDGQP